MEGVVRVRVGWGEREEEEEEEEERKKEGGGGVREGGIDRGREKG